MGSGPLIDLVRNICRQFNVMAATADESLTALHTLLNTILTDAVDIYEEEYKQAMKSSKLKVIKSCGCGFDVNKLVLVCS